MNAAETDIPRIDIPQIDIPEVKEEVEAVFAAYEAALVGNDVETLDRLFWDDARTIRYGGGENLHGIEEIRAFRRARSPAGLARSLAMTRITTFGRDMAVAATLFHRDSAPGKVGRQMQTWLRTPDGWKVVAAHVSVIDDPDHPHAAR
ncbi:oxalurate catabolism protein HpxZ [Salinarimonas sp.]|uniref:oxalurate catabolism protein HpxZ n=1 Tax=Salinarimonas sp. TaxID=2766526 RepID=UPI0032D95A5A